MDTAQHSDSVLYMAMELSNSKWKVRFGNGRKVRAKTIPSRDLPGLLEELSKARARLGLGPDAAVVSCYEAGRDGFWLHRFLVANGIENLVVDPASIEVNRRSRRAKTDRLDAEKLLVKLIQYRVYGEKSAWRVCRVPSEEAEDERCLGRELERLVKERTQHINRIKGLLATQGCAGVAAHVDLDAVVDWSGRKLPAGLHAQLRREQQRLALVCEQIRHIEQQRRERLREPQTEGEVKAQKMLRLRGVGPVSSWTLSKEFFAWRTFKNRREVGAAAGLTGTPYNSGEGLREQGISKAGSTRVRRTCIELAWMWIRHQPGSRLTIWFSERFAHGSKRQRRVGIVAVARKLLIALWKWVERDELPEGAVLSA